MSPDTYLAILDRALDAPHGLRLSFPDPETAVRFRRTLYRLRNGLRGEQRAKAQPTVATAYTADGRLWGVLDELKREPPPPTPYDPLSFRVDGSDVLIVKALLTPRVTDPLPEPEVSDLTPGEADELPPWPYFRGNPL